MKAARRDTETQSEDALKLLSGKIVDAAYRIHSALGPGLLESVYEAILAQELALLGLHVERQKPVPLEWNGLRFDEGFRADWVIKNCLIVEQKSVESFSPVHSKQLLTYLRLLNYRRGCSSISAHRSSRTN